MSDIFTRLLLDTKDFESKLGKAKNSTNDFSSNISGKVVGAVGKFAGAIGLAVGGVETFKAIMGSSQTTGDLWANTISACKSTVETFFQSLSTGNWDAFNQGLSGTISNMYRVSSLKDMLEDAKLTMGFDTKQFEREYVRLEGIINDTSKSKSEREAAFSDMEALVDRFKDRVRKTADGAANVLVTEMNAKFGKNFTLKDFETYITEVNNEFLNTETLQRLNKYKAELGEMQSGLYTTMSGGVGGTYTVKNKSVEKQIEAFKAQNAELEKLRILQDDNDKSRRDMLTQLEYANDLYRQADEYLKRSLEKQNMIASLNKGGNSGGKAPKTKAEEFPLVVPQMKYDTDLGMKVLQWMSGKDIQPIKVPIEIEEDNLEETLPQIKEMNGALEGTANIFGSLGSIAGQAGEDFLAATANSMGSIAQMIIQLQALSSAQGVASASKLPFPANLAAIATVVATIASVFSSLPKFAEGGVVGGSSFIGDKLLARLNSGETVLTQKQAARALSMMDGGNNVRVTGDVKLGGKDIYIVLRNYMKSSGNKL